MKIMILYIYVQYNKLYISRFILKYVLIFSVNTVKENMVSVINKNFRTKIYIELY